MKIGDVILVRGRGIISLLIRLVTRSKYSHVALALSDKHVLEIDWKYRLKINEIHYNHYDIYRFYRELNHDEIFKLLNFAYSVIGTKYDFKQIFSLFLEYTFNIKSDYLFNNPKKLICSDVVDLAYKEIGVDLIPNKEYQNVTPHDVSTSPKLKKIESVDLSIFDKIRLIFKRS